MPSSDRQVSSSLTPRPPRAHAARWSVETSNGGILRRNQTATFNQDRYAAALAGLNAFLKWSFS
jgi:hypothetical protein